jgi:DNA-directed RNA polymerase specialized sigma subunit
MARIKSLSVPPCISFEELESAAYMGLVDAATKFNPRLGFAFSSYARMRIDGEMKDYMRLSLIGNGVRLISDGEDFPCPEPSGWDVDLSCLDDREAKILRLYYIDNKAMKEIGSSEGISESRISQILCSCRKKLKRHMSRSTRR